MEGGGSANRRMGADKSSGRKDTADVRGIEERGGKGNRNGPQESP